MKTQKCIACKGKGVVPKTRSSKITEKQKQEIYRLYRKGTGFREIARIVKIKSPYSVQYAIKIANK